MFKKKNTAAKLIVMALLLSACANNEKNAQTAENQDPSLYSMESSDGSAGKSDDILFDDSPGPITKAETEEEQPVASESPEKVTDSEPVVAEMESSATISPDKMSVYRVQHNRETLMMIAYKIYGDYHRWREIAQINKEMFDERYVIKKGMMLKFVLPESEFKNEHKGEPFIIKWGDTLSSISKEVYDTLNRWKEIWHNNRPLIRNPDKIFAGFTIYYVPGDKPLRKKEAVKEVLPDLASTNPAGTEEVAQESAPTPAPVDPKVELEQIETAGPAKTQVPVESDSQASSAPAEAVIEGTESSDRNPTSL